jgi:outer membrane protein TolC
MLIMKGKSAEEVFSGATVRVLSAALFIFLVVVLPVTVRAAQPVELTLAQAYDMALQSNHDIKTAAEDVEQGKLLQKQAVTVLYPKLTANAGYSNLSYQDGTEIDGTSWGINLNQKIYNGGRVWVAKRGAQYTLNAAESGLEYARQSVLMELVARANDVLTAADLLNVSEKRVQRVQEQLRQAQARLDLGDVSRSSVLSAQVALSTVQFERVEALKTLALAQKKLSNLIGADFDLRVVVPEVIESLGEDELEVLLDRALEERPDLEQGRELIRISREEADLVSRNGQPDVDITGSYTRYSNEDFFAPETQLGISLTWPFFQGGLVRLQTREALSRTRQAEEAYGSMINAATLEVEEAWLTVRTFKSQEQLVSDNLKTALENHRLAVRRFELGAASSLEVLDAEENLAEAENLEVNHRYGTRTARAALLYSVGALGPGVFGPARLSEKAKP